MFCTPPLCEVHVVCPTFTLGDHHGAAELIGDLVEHGGDGLARGPHQGAQGRLRQEQQDLTTFSAGGRDDDAGGHGGGRV